MRVGEFEPNGGGEARNPVIINLQTRLRLLPFHPDARLGMQRCCGPINAWTISISRPRSTSVHATLGGELIGDPIWDGLAAQWTAQCLTFSAGPASRQYRGWGQVAIN